MRIFITGGTGLIGRKLVSELLLKRHHITLLTRSVVKAKQKLPYPELTFVNSLEDVVDFSDYDAVINLAGEPIFAKKWSPERKRQLTQSRVELTQAISEKINNTSAHRPLFISGSATGFYGDQGKTVLAENSDTGDNFTAKLCQEWESSALQADTRVCILRTGLVLSTEGGALAAMLPVYRFALGGWLGTGEQYWPWIHIDDMVRAIIYLLNSTALEGIFNCCAPSPIHNRSFNRHLAQQLKRPAIAPVPAFLLKALLGERSQLLLDSQRVHPANLQQAGFEFDFPHIAKAFEELINR